MKKKEPHKSGLGFIAQNKRARYEYFIKQELEAGLSLKGWEVKSLRSGEVNISDSYVLLKNSEAYLIGANFQPLGVASSHVVCDPKRSRKMLLHESEINFLLRCMGRGGYTIVALLLYWKNAWAKVKVGVAKGKKNYDKRASIKNAEWRLDRARIAKNFYR